MNRVSSHYQGYTIVETLIFLAVTGLLFISVMLLVGGQQGKTQFTTAIRGIDSKIQDVVNDIATGYYNNPNTFGCDTLSPGQPNISLASNTQGTNQDCVFVGRVIQFAEAGSNGERFNIMTMVGRRQTTAGKEVKNLFESQIIPVERGNGTNGSIPVSATESDTLDNGLSVQKMYYVDSGGAKKDIGAVGFFSTFAVYSGAGVGVASGSTTTNLLPITGSITYPSTLDKSLKDMVDATVSTLNTGVASGDPAELNTPNGVTICFKSASTDQYGVLTLGSNGRQLTTKVDIMTTAAATTAGGPC